MVLPDGDDLVLTSSYQVDHQLLEANPTGMVLSRNSTLNGEPPGPLTPVRVEWRYFLLPRSDEERILFESASSKDVHHVVKSAHASLTAYHGFFRSSSGA